MVSKKQRNKMKSLSVDLKGLHAKANNELGVVSLANKEILSATDNIQGKIAEVCQGKTIDMDTIPSLSMETGLEWSKSFLTDKGYDTAKIRLEDLLTNDEIIAIEAEVNRPLVDRLKWDKWDYIVMFSAAIMGSVADFMWGDPGKGLSAHLSDKDTLVGGWFEKIHDMHHTGSPMDYQGYKMGGGNHRLRSIGHDLFGFIQGIWQIKNGTFTGGYFEDGKWTEIVTEYNQYGTPYEKFSQMEAIWRYSVHAFCDFFSSKSLPVPGFGYLARMPIREVRKFADEMYKNNYNLRHMLVQALSIIVVEIVIRAYTHLKYRNIDIPKESLQLKKREMRLMAHCLVTSFNVGKIVVSKNPLLLNLPQLLFTSYQLWPFIIDNYRRNNRIQIMLRNLDEIDDEAEEKYMKSLSGILSTKEFGNFLNQAPITL